MTKSIRNFRPTRVCASSKSTENRILWENNRRRDHKSHEMHTFTEAVTCCRKSRSCIKSNLGQKDTNIKKII